MRLSACLLALLSLLPCVSAQDDAAAPAPPLGQLLRVFDSANQRELDLDGLVAALAEAEVVFFGETHLDETTHRLEAALFSRLLEARGGKVTLAMEMFERDVQPVLDAYVSGEIDEAEFLSKARVWHNYRTGYRAMVEAARAAGAPVVASNAPASLRMRVGFGGREAMDQLPEEQRAWLPAELFPNSDHYWDRFSRVVRGHMSMIAGQDPEKRLTSGQSLWDNTMGESCALARDRWPDRVVFHVNGGFHSQYREGAVGQLLARRPETRVVVIDAVPVNDLAGMGEWYAPDRADYLIACDARARGPQEGFHGVRLTPDLRYRLHMPGGAAPGRPVPLLVWLHDGGMRAADALARWSAAFGDEVAIAAIEGPFPQVEEDLGLGARWFMGETFMEDLGTVENSLGAVRDYVVRNFPIDPARVVLAGEGTGATVVAAAALYERGLDARFLAIAPRRFAKLRTLALPGPYPEEMEARPLEVMVAPADLEWWKEEAAEHARAKLTTTPEVVDGWWQAAARGEARVRELLGLETRPAPVADAGGRLLVVAADTPRARDWILRYGRSLEEKGLRVDFVGPDHARPFLDALDEEERARWTVETLRFLGEPDPLAGTEIEALPPPGPARLTFSDVIPLASGAFGGTTVLLVPAGADAETRAAWQKLEDDNVLGRRSRFHRLRVVFEDDEADSLVAALEEVKQAGRSSVLVVPAVFCADGDAMRRFAKPARPYEDTLAIEWLPGLGGGFARVPRDPH